MPRAPRVVVPGIPHHVTQRGARRLPTFFSDEDYRFYRAVLGERCRRAGVEVWAYCQMPNHVHLVVVPATEDALAEALRPAHSAYAREVNARKTWSGHLWQARFFSVPLTEARLIATVRYVLQNPVRAGLVEDVAQWSHSSARDLLGGSRDPLVTRTPLAGYSPDWAGLLGAPLATGLVEELRRAARTGRWIGDPAAPDAAEPQASAVPAA